MKKLLFLTMIFAMAISMATAQATTPTRKHHELGFTFSSLNGFGLRYKTGSDNNLFRITAMQLFGHHDDTYGREQDSIDYKDRYYGANLEAGWEHRFEVAPSFFIALGADAGFTYSRTEHNSYVGTNENWTKRNTFGPSISLVTGATYVVKNRLVLSAEISPSVMYSRTIAETSNADGVQQKLTTNAWSANLSTVNANLTVAYRFGK
jgi:hypothetical protein